MAQSYVALIHPPAQGSGYGVTFPDLPGCISAGKTREEALERAVEALGGHIAALKADGEPLPPARDFRALQADAEVAEDIAAGSEPSRIPVIACAAPKERVNIMLGRDVLRSIDRAAAARGVSRSAFIESAAGKAAKKG